MIGRILHWIITAVLAVTLGWMAYGDWRWLVITMLVVYLQVLNSSTNRAALRAYDRHETRLHAHEQVITSMAIRGQL